MANNKRRKAFMVSILIGILLTAGASFLAQTGTLFPKPGSRTLPEKEKEQSSQNKLSALLSTAGMRMGTPLTTHNAKSYREVRLSWESLQKPNSAGLVTEHELDSSGVLKQLSSVARSGSLPRERSMELAPDRLLVVAVDENEAVRWWRLMIDPRLVRAEVGPATEMQSRNFYLANVDFIVGCPDDPRLLELRFFHPAWNGESFQLSLVGATPLH